MAVIERENEIGYFLGDDPLATDSNEDEPLFCIETYEGSGVALCGARIEPGEIGRPMVQGPLDCQECWTIYQTLPD